MNTAAKLCQCNKCNTILIDKNPQSDATEYKLKGTEIEMLFYNDPMGGYWVCPVCGDDGNLQDNITISNYPTN